jgi:putative phosphoribosyl transferase
VEVARALDAPLDVLLVRKLGLPSQPELGFGAIGEEDVQVLDAELVARAGITDAQIAAVKARERAVLVRRVRRYRGERPPLSLSDRTVVIVDDGMATGSTALVAIEVARVRGARRIVVAVPVSPPETVARLAAQADEVVCLCIPAWFLAVGEWYDDFEQTTDDEVASLLQSGAGRDERSTQRVDREIAIDTGGVVLQGHLTVPLSAIAVIIFAHGSGSSRLSPRNQAMAKAFHGAGFGTLLFDLLTPDEADKRGLVFDVQLLGTRLLAATAWLQLQHDVGTPSVGYFGASTGAAAALWAAAQPGNEIGAVVSRGGRPDLTGAGLLAVRCPTLLIVGEADDTVLELNRHAASQLRCPHQLIVVPGATHLFEEPGTLEAVARLAIAWFDDHLVASAGAQ